ncbi:hypothetical protein BGZ50_001413, partial [Haplosporangium sp. Z 11]
MIELFNRTHNMVEFQPGSYVTAKENTVEGKLDPKYKGPYLVLRRTEFGSYELQDATKATLPRNYAPEQLKRVTQALDRANEESFEVQAILSHRDTVEGKRYLVKWKGYNASHNSEIAPEDFDSPAMMTRYHKQQRRYNP